MKRMAMVLVLVLLMVLCAGCGAEKAAGDNGGGEAVPTAAEAAEAEEAPAETPEPTAEPTPEPTAEPTPEPTATPEPAPQSGSFKAGDYTLYYEVVARDRVAEVVGDLERYADTEGVDMEKNRLFYIHYTSAKKDGKEVRLANAVFGISFGNVRFTVDGKVYTQPSILMSSGTQTYLSYLIVPAETPDTAAVSIRYN